jgi:hypothetical protein
LRLVERVGSRRGVRSATALLSLACLGAVTLAGPARAAETRDELRLELRASRGLLDLGDRPLSTSQPYQMAGLRFRGAGNATGVEFDLAGVVDGFRFGFGLSGYAVSGTSLGHVPLGPDLQAGLAKPRGLTVPVLFGRELDLGRVRPYLDLRLGVSLVHWEIEARSARLGELPPLVGTRAYLVLTPRLGVVFQLTDVLRLDAGFSGSPLGVERAGFVLGLVFAPKIPPARPSSPGSPRR